jgi:integrase/recombinase XerD
MDGITERRPLMEKPNPLLSSNYISKWTKLVKLSELSKINYLSELRKFDDYLVFSGFTKTVDFDMFYYYEETKDYGPIDEEFINEYLENLIDSYSNSVIHKNICALKNLFSFLLDYKLITSNPVKNINDSFCKPVIKDRSISVRECKKLLNAALEIDSVNKKYYVLLLLLITCGLRKQEVINLQYSDVNLEENMIIINKGKGNKARVVWMTELLSKQLADYFMSQEWIKTKKVYVFTHKNKQFGREKISRVIDALTKKAKITRKINVHMFRHTAAKLLYESTNDINFVRKQLGHANLSTTLRYLPPKSELYDLLNNNIHNNFIK